MSSTPRCAARSLAPGKSRRRQAPAPFKRTGRTRSREGSVADGPRCPDAWGFAGSSGLAARAAGRAGNGPPTSPGRAPGLTQPFTQRAFSPTSARGASLLPTQYTHSCKGFFPEEFPVHLATAEGEGDTFGHHFRGVQLADCPLIGMGGWRTPSGGQRGESLS